MMSLVASDWEPQEWSKMFKSHYDFGQPQDHSLYTAIRLEGKVIHVRCLAVIVMTDQRQCTLIAGYAVAVLYLRPLSRATSRSIWPQTWSLIVKYLFCIERLRVVLEPTTDSSQSR